MLEDVCIPEELTQAQVISLRGRLTGRKLSEVTLAELISASQGEVVPNLLTHMEDDRGRHADDFI